MHRLVLSCAIAVCTFAVPLRGTAAGVVTTYDTIDAVETSGDTILRITGIVTGDSAPTTSFYNLGGASGASRCDRLALLAIARPGKYQLSFNRSGSISDCKLTVRTP